MAKVHILLAAWIVLDLVFATAAQGHGQIDALISFLRKRSSHGFTTTEWSSQDLELPKDSTYLTESNDELAVQQQQQADLIINGLPGQPAGIKFSQYSGFVTVNASTGRALFYYFTEATEDPESKPVLLWLNGGPGCSSVGYGAMEELGPFRPNADGTLSYNPYGWNQVANVLFLDSPAGVGFSYSNTSSDYLESGDKRTAEDSYAFLVNWFERFPQYKSREFYIAGESYAGNYIPELADTILNRKRLSQASFINFEGVMIGNGLMNAETDHTGIYIYAWSHSLISDQTYTGLMRYCTNLTFISPNRSQYCEELNNKFYNEIGRVDLYGIYAPLCVNGSSTLPTQGKSLGAPVYDPCMDDHVMRYMNRSDVQNAFHVTVPEPWSFCNNYVGNVWTDSAASVLPIYAKLISAGIRILVFSGDTDSVVPVTSTRLGIKALNLTIQTPWYTWANKTTDAEVYGYTEIYKGLTFATVRRAGHTVPSYEPEIALDLVTNFLAGKPLTKQ